MNKYLTIKKVLEDSVAIYKTHFIYITAFITAIIVPYGMIVTKDSLPDIAVLIVPLCLIVVMMVEIVSTNLAATSYIHKDFNIAFEFKLSTKKVMQYTFLYFLSAVFIFMGISILIIPALLINIFSNILKVNYIVNDKSLLDSVKDTVNLFKGGIFKQVIKIYLLPIAVQLIIGVIISMLLDPNILVDQVKLEEAIVKIYPYITASFIIIFPISICFRTAIYFNIIKEKDLNSSNQFV